MAVRTIYVCDGCGSEKESPARPPDLNEVAITITGLDSLYLRGLDIAGVRHLLCSNCRSRLANAVDIEQWSTPKFYSTGLSCKTTKVRYDDQ